MRCSPLAFEATVSFPQNQICHWTTKPQWFVTLLLNYVKRFLGRDRQQKTIQEEPVGGGLFFLAFGSAECFLDRMEAAGMGQ